MYFLNDALKNEVLMIHQWNLLNMEKMYLTCDFHLWLCKCSNFVRLKS